MQPSISIIIPVHNAALFLRETLEHILDQTWRDWELICVENGSTDASPAILEEYAARDTRIRLLKLSPVGAGAARNAGLEQARGKYVCMCDADDFYTPQALERLYARAEKTQADVVVGMAEFFYSENHRERSPYELKSSVLCHVSWDGFCPMQETENNVFELFQPWGWGKLYRRDYLNQHNIRYTTHRRAEDAPFVLLAVALAQKVALLNEVCYEYRQQESSLSHNLNKEPHIFLDAFLYLLQRAQELGFSSPALCSCRRVILAHCAYQCSLMPAGVARECFRRIRETYEPLFGIIPSLEGDAAVRRNYVVYRSLVAPEQSIFIDFTHGWQHFEYCLGSLENHPSLYAALFVLRGTVPPGCSERLSKYAEKHYRIQIVDNASSAPTEKKYIISASRGIEADAPLDGIFSSASLAGAELPELSAGTFGIFCRFGLCRTAAGVSWSICGRAFFRLLITPEQRTFYLLGRKIFSLPHKG